MDSHMKVSPPTTAASANQAIESNVVTAPADTEMKHVQKPYLAQHHQKSQSHYAEHKVNQKVEAVV